MAHNNADPFIVTSDAVARGMEERRQRQQRETMAQNVGFISYLHGLDHLYRMEELIVSGEATVDFLTLEDYRTLERMHPKGIPPTIREKLFGAHELITMRILAAKGPEGIVEMTGNLFDAPKDAVLMHACNTLGRWGAGIALDFQYIYPDAFYRYRAYCIRFLDNPEFREVPGTATQQARGQMTRVVQRPEGQCLLIPPQKLDSEGTGRRHWIACLFTSRRPGGGDPDTILANTKLAVADMNRQIQQIYSEQIIEGEEIGYPGHLWSCRINSGHFRVPWKSTKGVLKESGLGMFVVRRASDPA